MSIKSTIQRIEILRDSSSSSYTAVELNSVLNQNTILNDDPQEADCE